VEPKVKGVVSRLIGRKVSKSSFVQLLLMCLWLVRSLGNASGRGVRIPAALVWRRARPIGTRRFRDFEGPISQREHQKYVS
jgi:hypothetical protein